MLMHKIFGLVMLALGDVLLVRYCKDKKQQPSQCLWEMIAFLSGLTYSMTEMKRTLEKAICQEKNQGYFPKIFQKEFALQKEKLPLREAIDKALEILPLPREASGIISHYFSVIGKATKKSTEESYQAAKLRLEEILAALRKENEKAQKLISASVYATSAMAAILFM